MTNTNTQLSLTEVGLNAEQIEAAIGGFEDPIDLSCSEAGCFVAENEFQLLPVSEKLN